MNKDWWKGYIVGLFVGTAICWFLVILPLKILLGNQ